MQYVLTSGDRDLNKKEILYQHYHHDHVRELYLINSSTTITRNTITITKAPIIPMNAPMMFTLPTDGSVSPCVWFTSIDGGSHVMAHVLKSVVTKKPVKNHHQ